MAVNRKVAYEEIVTYVTEHPELTLTEIGQHFGLSQGSISRILRKVGQGRGHRGHGGRRPKRKPGMTDEQALWEQKLHDAGLGVDRGLRIHNKRILYTANVVETTF